MLAVHCVIDYNHKSKHLTISLSVVVFALNEFGQSHPSIVTLCLIDKR